MKTTITIKQEIEVKSVRLKAGVRYWEDATVNGVEDAEGDLIPLRDGEYWCPEIDIDTGRILNWPEGTTADIHYKVCDDGSYYLIDDKGNTIGVIEDDYVPNSLIPGSYGDYIIMQVNEQGIVTNWPKKPSFSRFFDD